MIINTFSYLWTSSAVDAMCELTRSGYRTFEVPISAPHCWPDEISPRMRLDSKARLDDCGASIRSLNAGGYDINLASPAANMRAKSIAHIQDVMDLAFDWGVKDVVISPGTRRPMISPTVPMALGWLYESLEHLLPRAKQAGVRLLLENTPYCFRPTMDLLVAVVNEVNNDDLKIVYDVANAAFIGEDCVACLRSAHAAIALVHVSDTGRDEWGHDPIGTGIINFKELGAAVEDIGMIDNIVLEIIREKEPLQEIEKGMKELSKRGWKLGS